MCPLDSVHVLDESLGLSLLRQVPIGNAAQIARPMPAVEMEDLRTNVAVFRYLESI